MSSLRHLFQGMKIVRENRLLIAIAFLPKLALSLLFMMPLQGLISAYDHRPAIASLLTESDMNVIIDGLFSHLGALRQYGYFSLAAMVMVYFVHLFLSGGLLQSLAACFSQERELFSPERFFVWCGRHFTALLKIAAISAVLYMVVAALWMIVSEAGVRLIAGEPAPEPVRFCAALARVVVLVLLLMLVNAAVTYGRIAVVVHPRHSLRETLSMAWLFWGRNFIPAVFLSMALMLGLVLMMGVYWALSAGSGLLPTAIGVVTLFAVQQVLSLTRSWYRLVGYASQTGLYVARQG